jgi:hypothetical protein
MQELEILKKSSQQHFVQLIGLYTHNKCLGMLLYLVAVCDLQTFFEDAEAHWKDSTDDGQTKRLEQLGY